MNKKILIGSIFAVLMLVTISFTSAVSTNTNVDKKDSPLYRIRAKLAIGEKISNIIENIKTKFLGERIFFLPFQWIINMQRSRLSMASEYASDAQCHYVTCKTCIDPPSIMPSMCESGGCTINKYCGTFAKTYECECR